MMLTPIFKYQKSFEEYIKNANALPKEQLDYSIYYAGYVDAGGTLSYSQFIKLHKMLDKKNDPLKPQKRRPYYIRDKHNPNILYPYVEK